MELLGTKQMKRARILLLIRAQTLVPALGRAQTVPLPEPPRVRASRHVVSLTLHPNSGPERCSRCARTAALSARSRFAVEVDLQQDGQTFEIVALDGMPLA